MKMPFGLMQSTEADGMSIGCMRAGALHMGEWAGSAVGRGGESAARLRAAAAAAAVCARLQGIALLGGPSQSLHAGTRNFLSFWK